MFRDVGPLPNLVVPALFGLLGAVAGWWIQKQIRRRRLMKLGFSADDLRSKEQFFKRLGEISVAKIPQKISLKEITSHSWSKPTKYEQSKAAFEELGFRRAGIFVGSPQEWVAEFWLSGEPGLFAKIMDSGCGVYSEVTSMNQDGVAVSFENTEECGLKHREPDTWVHCGLVAPTQLVERALHHRQPNDTRQLNLADCVSAYEQSVNENLAWRRIIGISADEAKRAFERRKRRQRDGS